MTKTITLNRNDYYFYGGNTTILVRIGANDTDQHMDAENIIPNWIMKRCVGYWGYSNNNGIEFKVLFY
jgi:hypothetical protein